MGASNMFFKIKKQDFFNKTIAGKMTGSFFRKKNSQFCKFIFTFSGLLGGLSGCNWFFAHKDKPENSPMEISLKHTECFKNIPEMFSRYINQKLNSESDLHGAFGCVDRAITVFTQRTTGGNDVSSYKYSELRAFFKKYIFQKEVSNDLILEIIKMKVGLIGGSSEVITKEEFVQIQELLPFFEKQMLKLYPHIGVLLSKSSGFFVQKESSSKVNSHFTSSSFPNVISHLTNSNQNDPSIETAITLATEELKNSIRTILAKLNLESSGYSLTDFYQLFSEIEALVDHSDSENGISQFKNNILALKKIKTLFAGEPLISDKNESSQTLPVYDTLIDGFKLSLLFKNDIKGREWTSLKDANAIEQWMNGVLQIIQKSFQLRNSHEIPLDHIDAALEALYDRGVWLQPLKLETAKSFYRQFIVRFIDPNQKIQDLKYFDLKHFQKIELEYQTYLAIQKSLMKVFSHDTKISIKTVRNEIQKIMTENDTQSLLWQNDDSQFKKNQEFVQDAWAQFLVLISSKEIRHWDSEGRVSMTQHSENQFWTFQELSFLNLIRIPTQLIMLAYRDKTLDRQATVSAASTVHALLTVDRLRALYNEFKDFGSQMYLFDLRNEDSAARNMREADLFTPSGNGDTQIQFVELFDFMAVRWSGGQQGVSNFKALAKSESCELSSSKPDSFNQPYLQMDCASRTFRKYFDQVFPNLPLFDEFIKSLNNDQWKSFYSDLMQVSRVCLADNIGLETGDQRTMMVIIHYIENLFALYDSNSDGQLDVREVERAYPRFQKFFLEQPEVQKFPIASELTSEMIFKFVVLRGYKPTGLWDLATFQFSQNQEKADRQKLVKVFATLKSNISRSTTASCYAN